MEIRRKPISNVTKSMNVNENCDITACDHGLSCNTGPVIIKPVIKDLVTLKPASGTCPRRGVLDPFHLVMNRTSEGNFSYLLLGGTEIMGNRPRFH